MHCLTSERRLANNFNALSHIPPATPRSTCSHILLDFNLSSWQSIQLNFTTTEFNYISRSILFHLPVPRRLGDGEGGDWYQTKDRISIQIQARELLDSTPYKSFSHHYWGSVDFILSIFIALQGCISQYSLAKWMIFNDMIYRDHIFIIS